MEMKACDHRDSLSRDGCHQLSLVVTCMLKAASTTGAPLWEWRAFKLRFNLCDQAPLPPNTLIRSGPKISLALFYIDNGHLNKIGRSGRSLDLVYWY